MSLRNLPWYKRCPADWRNGTRSCGMSMELRGFYSECLDAMWEMQGPLPADPKRLALLLGCNPRTVAKLMPQLITAGKIVATWYGFYNPRMMADISEPRLPIDHGAAARVAASFRSTSPRVRAEFEPKVPKNPENTTREEESDSDSDSPPDAGEGEIEIGIGGRVVVPPAIAAVLTADLPGVDVAAAADMAAPEILRMRAPSAADKLAVVRKWARIAQERQQRRLRPIGFASPHGGSVRLEGPLGALLRQRREATTLPAN